MAYRLLEQKTNNQYEDRRIAGFGGDGKKKVRIYGKEVLTITSFFEGDDDAVGETRDLPGIGTFRREKKKHDKQPARWVMVADTRPEGTIYPAKITSTSKKDQELRDLSKSLSSAEREEVVKRLRIYGRLDQSHAHLLEKRGITLDEAIDDGYFVISNKIAAEAEVPVGFPGFGRKNNDVYSWVLGDREWLALPLSNPKGEDVGFQITPVRRKPEDEKYMWLGGQNASPHLPEYDGELPLTYFDPKRGEKRTGSSDKRDNVLMITEGVLKPRVAARLHGVRTLGYAGSNWNVCPKQLKEFSQFAKDTSADPSQFEIWFAVDAGAARNPQVAKAVWKTCQLLETAGFVVKVIWYSQWQKPETKLDKAIKGDIDEVSWRMHENGLPSTGKRSSPELISPEKFGKHAHTGTWLKSNFDRIEADKDPEEAAKRQNWEIKPPISCEFLSQGFNFDIHEFVGAYQRGDRIAGYEQVLRMHKPGVDLRESLIGTGKTTALRDIDKFLELLTEAENAWLYKAYEVLEGQGLPKTALNVATVLPEELQYLIPAWMELDKPEDNFVPDAEEAAALKAAYEQIGSYPTTEALLKELLPKEFHYLIAKIMEWRKAEYSFNRKAYLIGCRNSFLSANSLRLDFTLREWIKDEHGAVVRCDRLALCADSILQIPLKNFIGAYLLFDEIRSLLTHVYTGATCAEDRDFIANWLKKGIEIATSTGGYVLGLDGMVDATCVDWLSDCVGSEVRKTLQRNEYKNPDRLWNCHFYPGVINNEGGLNPFDSNNLVEDFFQTVDEKIEKETVERKTKKTRSVIAFCADSMSMLHTLNAACKGRTDSKGNKVALKTLLMTSHHETEAEKQFLKNPELYLKNNPVDIVFYSPRVSAGTSFDSPLVSKCFGVFVGCTSVDEAIQQLGRPRKNCDRYVFARPQPNIFGYHGFDTLDLNQSINAFREDQIIETAKKNFNKQNSHLNINDLISQIKCKNTLLGYENNLKKVQQFDIDNQYWARIVAEQNCERQQYRIFIEARIKRAGHSLTTVEPRFKNKELSKWLNGYRKQVEEEEGHGIAEAEDKTLEWALEKSKQDLASKPNTRRAVKKAMIRNELGIKIKTPVVKEDEAIKTEIPKEEYIQGELGITGSKKQSVNLEEFIKTVEAPEAEEANPEEDFEDLLDGENITNFYVRKHGKLIAEVRSFAKLSNPEAVMAIGRKDAFYNLTKIRSGEITTTLPLADVNLSPLRVAAFNELNLSQFTTYLTQHIEDADTISCEGWLKDDLVNIYKGWEDKQEALEILGVYYNPKADFNFVLKQLNRLLAGLGLKISQEAESEQWLVFPVNDRVDYHTWAKYYRAYSKRLVERAVEAEKKIEERIQTINAHCTGEQSERYEELTFQLEIERDSLNALEQKTELPPLEEIPF